MACLPAHGRVACSRCFPEPIEFNRSRSERAGWRITANPLAWGGDRPEVLVLGFSKGPEQAGAIDTALHDSIAYKGARKNVGKILRHVGLLDAVPDEGLAGEVDRLIADRAGRFHFASLVRCTVERFDARAQQWKGTGGGMLEGFMAAPLGAEVARNCTHQHLAVLPSSTRVVIMFGMGTGNSYTRSTARLIQQVRPGPWTWFNEVTYYDQQVAVVHVEHFRSQGALIPQWLGERQSPRSRLGQLAREGVKFALTRCRGETQ